MFVGHAGTDKKHETHLILHGDSKSFDYNARAALSPHERASYVMADWPR